MLTDTIIEICSTRLTTALRRPDQLNTDRTELKIFGTRQMLLNLRKINCNIAGDIDVTSCAKNLGVIFDNTSSMNDHINLII